MEKTFEEAEKDIEAIIQLIDTALAQPRVPKNVRIALEAAKQRLQEGIIRSDIVSGASGATYALDEASADVNLPPHARSLILNILSELEVIKEKFGAQKT